MFRWPFYPTTVVNSFYSPDSPILKDRINWMHICDTIRATGLERYLVIGSTRDSTTAIIEQTGPRWGGALYYLDDVSVRKIAGGTVGRRRIREVCADELPVQLAARAGFEHYRWSTSTGDTMATLSVSAAGSYWVAQDYGCGYVIDTIELRVAPPYQPPSGWADLSLRRDTLICASGLPLRLQGRAGFARYRWSTGDPTQATEAFSAGRYLLHLDEGYAAGCGQLVDTFAVAVEAQGPPIELGPDRINCQADRLQAVTLDAGPDQPQYRWSTGEITQAITVQDPGQYWVAAAHAVCLDRSDSLHLLGCEPLRVIIDLPTVFTPNADGLNDRWLGQYANVQFTRLLVWDRWGRMVFDTTDPQQAWDGTARGKRQPPGVYFYHWTGQADDAPSQRRGTVTLLR